MADDIVIRDATGTEITVSTKEIDHLNGAAATPRHVQRLAPVRLTGTGAEDIDLVGEAGDEPPDLAPNASGPLGWLRKIADALAGLSAQLPGALSGGRLKTEITQAAETTLEVDSPDDGVLATALANIASLLSDQDETPGAWGQSAGAGADTVTVPDGARLHNVEIIPTSPTGVVTLAVFGDAEFTQVEGYGIGRDYRGKRIAGAAAAGQIVIGGDVGTYHVDWIV